jgi:hypothetical protein
MHKDWQARQPYQRWCSRGLPGRSAADKGIHRTGIQHPRESESLPNWWHQELSQLRRILLLLVRVGGPYISKM